jgi:hypothetical protein
MGTPQAPQARVGAVSDRHRATAAAAVALVEVVATGARGCLDALSSMPEQMQLRSRLVQLQRMWSKRLCLPTKLTDCQGHLPRTLCSCRGSRHRASTPRNVAIVRGCSGALRLPVLGQPSTRTPIRTMYHTWGLQGHHNWAPFKQGSS